MATNKKELYELIDKLSERDIPLISELIERLIHPADYHIPFDDEPITEDDLKAIEQGRKEFREGNTIKLEDILHDLQN